MTTGTIVIYDAKAQKVLGVGSSYEEALAAKLRRYPRWQEVGDSLKVMDLADVPPLFDLGQTVITPQAREALIATRAPQIVLGALLTCHAMGCWGGIDAEDEEANDKAARAGGRVLSVYEVAGQPLWILTEADRSVTTILRPEDW